MIRVNESAAKQLWAGAVAQSDSQQREPFEWLNDRSRAFLAGGYLLPGVTPEQRIRQIAERAEELLPGMRGFADKFYDYISRGW